MERTKLLARVIIVLILLIDAGGRVAAQNSPAPMITDYAGSALPDTLAPDTAFCKGAVITLHGRYFKRATGGESWDTTRVFFGGLSGVQGQILSLSSAGGGLNDNMTVRIPDLFPADTCLGLTLIKTTTAGAFTFNYTFTDTVCLIGDYAEVSYADTLFCIGEPNPLPSVLLGPGTTGAFCCASGAAGFFVLPSGEVPLYNGSAGIDNRFEYRTTHPHCGDTMLFKFDILQTSASEARYNGLSSLTLCITSTSFPVADTATLAPAYGLGHFADPTGNVFVMDSLTGRIDPGQCAPGTHDLLYIPHAPCYDTAIVSVTVQSPATAQVIYPGISGFPPQLCQSDPVRNPAFLSGSPGGQFWSVPGGVAFGQVGEIIPSGCAAGSYDVFYRPAGSCADTVAVLTGLVVDSAVASNIGFTNQSLCVSDTLNLGVLPPGWCGVFQGTTSLYTGPNAVLPLSQYGFSGGEALQVAYSMATVCADTDFATVNVLAFGNSSFSYPNPAYCLGDPNPYPVMAGQGGGTYTALSSGTVVSPSSGQLNLAASGPGQHTITYTTSGACPASDTVTVFIYSAASAQFSYPASTFCLGEPDPTPTVQGAPGGTFTADSGLVVNPGTGVISISQSAPGTYNVTYTLSGGCNTSFSQTIQIIPFDSSSWFSYPSEGYCRDGDNPRPAISGDSAGTFYGSLGLVFSNRDSGIVDLSRTGPGTYVITLDLDNRCALDPRDTITVLDLDDSFFSYSESEVCEGGAPLPVDTVAFLSGAFTSHSSIVFFDSAGTIDLNASTPGGPYPISYTTGGPCPSTSQRLITVFPRPRGVVLESHPGSVVCSGEQITFRAVASGATGYGFFVNGDPVQGTFDLYQSDGLSDGDSILCVLTNSAGCTDTLSATAGIAPVPEAVVTRRPGTIARLDPLRVRLLATVDGTRYRWTAEGVGPVQLYREEGETVPLGFGEETALEVGFRLTTTTDPARVRITVRPLAGTCEGKADTVWAEILPSTPVVFIPEVMTPDGNGLNDTWMISWTDEINPEDYEIRLYNRAGGEVALIRPLHPNWDGENLPDGVYWWKLSGRDGRAVVNGSAMKGPDGGVLLAGGLTIRRK